MKKTYDVMVTTGEYPDRETGQMKKRRMPIASIFTDEDTGHMSLKIDCVPVGLKDWQGWAAVFPVRDRDRDRAKNGTGQRPAPSQGKSAADEAWEEGDDIPF